MEKKFQLQEISYNLIKNKNPIFACEVFKLNEAVYEHQSNNLIEAIPIFDLKLNFFEAETKFDDILLNVNNHLDIVSVLSKHSLKRLGYYYDTKLNDFHLFYYKENYKMFVISEYLEKLSNKKFKINKLHLIYELSKIVTICHENHIKISLIHPNLIFYNDFEFKFCDVIFDDIIETVDKIKNFSLSKYFGYFDLDIIDSLNNANCEKEIEMIYMKTDVLLLICILSMIFHTKVYGRREEYIGIEYNDLLIELQNDWFIGEDNYCLIKNLKEDDIIDFIKENFSYDINKISGIHQFSYKLKSLYMQELNILSCTDCKQTNSKIKKIVLNKCKDVVCELCQKSHLCLREDNKHVNKYDFYSSEITRMEQVTDAITNVDHNHISKFYESSLNIVFSKICDVQSKIEQMITLEGDKINNIIIFINKLLDMRNEEEFRIINQDLDNYYNYLEENKKKFENVLGSSPNRRKFTGIKRKLTGIKLDSNEEIKVEEDIENNEIEDQGYNLDDASELQTRVENYKHFVEHTERFKEAVNNDAKVINVLSLIEKQADSYILEIGKCVNDAFIKSLSNTKSEIDILIDRNYNLKSNNNEKDQIKKNNIELIGCMDIKNCSFYYYNVANGGNIEKRNITFYDKKVVVPFDDCRWINLGNKLFVCGGIGMKNNKILPTAVAYIIDMNETDMELQVEIANNMIFSRDKHMIIKLDELNIMVMGGYETNTCEIYNFISDSWKEIPKLNRYRYDSSLYLHNDIIYVCFGFEGNKDGGIRNNKKISLSNIERYNLMSMDSEWDIINIETTAQLSLCGIIPDKSYEKIYILGGKGSDDMLSEKVYQLCFKKFTLTPMFDKNLIEKKAFYESTLFKISDNKWASFDTELNFSIFESFI